MSSSASLQQIITFFGLYRYRNKFWEITQKKKKGRNSGERCLGGGLRFLATARGVVRLQISVHVNSFLLRKIGVTLPIFTQILDRSKMCFKWPQSDPSNGSSIHLLGQSPTAGCFGGLPLLPS